MSAQEQANLDNAYGKGPVNCTYILRAQAKAYPRTCQRCGLGPCPFYRDEPASSSMTQPDKLVVSQEARDAAADLFCILHDVWPGYSAAHAIREGDDDKREVAQAFQRAMTQAADERQEMCAKELDDLADACRSAEAIGCSPARAEAFEYAAATIRSVKENGDG